MATGPILTSQCCYYFAFSGQGTLHDVSSGCSMSRTYIAAAGQVKSAEIRLRVAQESTPSDRAYQSHGRSIHIQLLRRLR